MHVPFIDLAALHAPLLDDLLSAARRVIAGGQYILHDEVSRFEQRIAGELGSRYCIGTNSGTDALMLALRAEGIGAGDEVILPANSFVATAGAVAAVGATPVFADVGPDFNIDPISVHELISERTRAVIVVHLYGMPADIPALVPIARDAGISLIEDCAQSLFASIDGVPVGTFGSMGCFSFHPLKNLGAFGDGGAIITDNDQIAVTIRQDRNHGLQSRDECVSWGLNCRLDELQAALLNVKLAHIGAWVARRREIALIYHEMLADLPLVLPLAPPGRRSIYQSYVIRTAERDQLQQHLVRRDIETKIHYPIPIHRQRAAGAMPCIEHVEQLSREILSLPIRPDLRDDQVMHVAGSIREFYQRG